MIDARFRTITILHLGLVASIGIYGFVLFQATLGQTPRDLDPVMLYTLAGISLAMMVVIPVLRGKMLPPMRAARSLDEPVPEGDKVDAAAGKLFTASIVTWALCESMAIYGLVLSFTSYQMKYFLPFAALSLLNFLIYRPRKEQLLAVARAAG